MYLKLPRISASMLMPERHMDTLLSTDLPATLTSKQRTALISLLVDDDPAIYDMVRRRILDYGRVACEWLRPYMLSNDPAMRRRALEIVHHLARQDSDERFLDFCLHNGEELDLEQAMGLLAQTQYPDTNPDAYRALYDHWAGELRARIDFTGEPATISRCDHPGKDAIPVRSGEAGRSRCRGCA